ncbi:hypothetical protein PPYR_00065 [Photinus pyralis]|uniref:Uncharacterized protein n=2 Tax=Photinus pyralis TaxID=7054 RepID=A0A5N4B0H9_PHOPY|nr:hypothetical protein PPYR_00065 [Photinus pyralis]
MTKTGGGETEVIEFTQIEEDILQTIPSTATEGIPGSIEIDTSFNFELAELPPEEISCEVDVPLVEITYDEENQPSTSTAIYHLNEDHAGMAKELPCRPNKNVRRLSKSSKLENSLKVQQNLTESYKENSQMLAEYYKVKIDYLRHKKNCDTIQTECVQKMLSILENSPVLTKKNM